MSTSDPELQKTFDALVESTDAKRISSGDFKGTCPSHDDRTASLSLGLTDDKILLNCYAGCKFDNIVSNLNLAHKDLFVKGTQNLRPKRKKPLTAILELPESNRNRNSKK